MGAAERVESVTYDVVDGRAILVDPHGRELLTLNRVGTMIWEVIDGRHDVQQLVEHLTGRLEDVQPEQARSDVISFLAELRGLGLVTD